MTPRRFQHYALPIALVLILLAQMAAASPSQSAAFDEGYQITFGYTYLRTGDIRLSRGQNPPLTNVLIAAPLLLRGDIAFPIDHSTWADSDIYGFSDEFLWTANPNPHQLILLTRLPEMALALLLACVVCAFARLLFGGRAALAALFVSAFDPNLIAHGHTAGTDLGVTLFLCAAVWMWAAALSRSSLRRALAAGLLAGAALSSKYSAAWLGPALLLIAVTYPPSAPAPRLWAAQLRLIAALAVAAFAVIWATFGLSFGPLSPGGVSVPAPDYWQSLGRVAYRVESSTPAFLLGRISADGFPEYYPLAFLVKTPLPTLIFVAIGIGCLIVRRDRRSIAVIAPPLIFIAAAVWGQLNLGYRLILPVLPFALIIAGRGFEAVWNAGFSRPQLLRRAGRLAAAAAGLWIVIDALAIAPNHLAYFNILAGPRPYEVLVDSNLDWGQDLIALREWMSDQRIDSVNLAYFGTAHPDAYGIAANLLPSFARNDFGPEVDGFNAAAPEPGWYAISATSLQLGLLYSHWDMYAPFRARPPDARIGRSILAYHVEYPSSEADRAVVLGPPAADLDRATLGGRPDRRLIVKWAGDDAAVFDMQGAARYVARGGQPLAGFAPEVHQALIASAERLGSDASGNLRLFEIDARRALVEKLAALQQRGESAEFEGGLTLLGYDLIAEPGMPIDLVTYWQARETPTGPLAAFAHVTDAEGRLLSQGDGLNVRWSALEPGDVILQHFVIDRPADAAWLDLGLYDPAVGNRMSARLPGGSMADRLHIPLPRP